MIGSQWLERIQVIEHKYEQRVRQLNELLADMTRLQQEMERLRQDMVATEGPVHTHVKRDAEL